jgi:hypothetical protein
MGRNIVADEMYVPGTFNIGLRERERQRRIALVYACISLVLYGILRGAVLGGWIMALSLWGLQPSVFIAVFSYLQYYMHFSVGFGFLAVYNFTKAHVISNIEDIREDRVRAMEIVTMSIAISIGVTAILVRI